jgi:hypothetical protein
MDEQKKTPSKRGRKPKTKKEPETKVPKKRGRKPKNNIIVNENPEFDGKYDEDITVKLIINDVESKNKNNIIDCKESDKNQYDLIPIDQNSKCSQICWNCSHPLENKRGIPIKYIKDIFYTYGDFCSDKCCLRYAYDTYDDTMYYDILSNLQLKREIDDIENKQPLTLPPSKYTLNIYGGPLSIEQYLQTNESYKIEISNCIHLNHIFNKNENRIKNTDELIGDLKLYRKNTVFKNDVSSYYQ